MNNIPICCFSMVWLQRNEKMQTNDPHVWAVGDAVEVRNSALGGEHTWAVALGGPANRQGRVCADNIAQIPAAGKYGGALALELRCMQNYPHHFVHYDL